MRLENLGPTTFVLGLLALAGVAFLLQRLRVRHRELEVVTTLFWHEAVEETRARVLVQRFRHPWAYLLVVAVLSLLWLGVAGPRTANAEGRDYVLLLDGSAGMAHGSRFDEARRAVEEEVARLPRDRTTVVLCGASPYTLLAPGEESLLLSSRLEGIGPEAAPASVEDEIRLAAATADGSDPLSVLVFGDAPVRDDVADGLPEGVDVRRVETGDPGAARAGNRGIVAIGVSAAESGAWDAVDVLVEVAGDLSGGSDLALALDGEPLDANAVRTEESGTARFLVRGLAARGGVLEARLAAADPFPLDDAARIALPDRPRIRVVLSPSVEMLFRAALEADAGVVVVTGGEADVAIRRTGESAGTGLPALELVAEENQEEAFLLTHLPQDGVDEGSERVLARALGELGLDRVDATTLADASGRTIAVGARAGTGRSIGVWASLLGEDTNFRGSRAFPLFVARSTRWLAGARDFARFAAAGEPVAVGDTPWTDASGRALDPVGAPLLPPRAGDYTTASGDVVAVSLCDPAATVGDAAPGLAAEDAEASGGFELASIILLFVLALLLAEWVLFRSGRIP